MTECIHGLEIAMCDVCSPRRAPEPPRSARAGGPPTRTPRASTASRSSSAPARVNPANQRIYLVVARERLREVLGELDAQDWRSDVGSATDAFRWPDASIVERPADLVVLVANLAGELQIIAAANEPARRATREILDEAGSDVRLVLQPGWWT